MSKKFKEALQKARKIKVDNKFYAESYLSNIYNTRMSEKHIRMFCKGEGKELLPKNGEKEKAACIYSSSMLSYNFFSWIDQGHTLEYDGIIYDKVIFEEQFRVLKSRNNKANIDVVLISKDNKTILLLESKFTEHLKLGPIKISDTYDIEQSYFDGGEKWVEIVRALRNSMSMNEQAYYEGLKQVVCHLIGISSTILNEHAKNWFNNNSWMHHIEDINITDNTTIIFKSIVFNPNVQEEGARTGEYIIHNQELVKQIAEKSVLPKNLIITNPIITYRDIWDKGMKSSIKDHELRKFLENYLEVHV